MLRHLRAHRPDWEIDVRVGPGRASLFRGLCRRALEPGDAPDRAYARTLRLPFPEAHAETKTARCLREVFGLVPAVELMAYEVRLGEEPLAAADAYYRSLGLDPDPATRRFPAVVAHYKGNSSPHRKNLPDAAILPLADRCRHLGLRLVVLDWDDRTAPEVAAHPAVTMCRPAADAATVAALVERASAWLGIDSGPGHLGGATSTPGVVVWTRHHPVRFYDWSMPHVLHLVPPDLDRLPPRRAARPTLDRYYGHATYSDLGADLALRVPAVAGLAPPEENPMSAGDAAKLKARNFHAEYYEEHRAAGLDYLGHGEWQESYGRWVVGGMGWAGADVLDVGCACGSIAYGLRKAGAVAHGIDLNNHTIALGRDRFPGLPLYVCDAVNLHLFGDASFGGVHHNQVAEHWRPELVPFILAELFRVLRPGGTLFAVMDTRELFERQGRSGESEDPTNRCVESLDWWRDRYAAAGFVPDPDAAGRLESHPRSFFRRYDWDWLVLKKPA